MRFVMWRTGGSHIVCFAATLLLSLHCGYLRYEKLSNDGNASDQGDADDSFGDAASNDSFGEPTNPIIDDVPYAVAGGYTLTAPLALSESDKNLLIERSVDSIALPPEGSAFGASAYLGIRAPVEILGGTIGGGALVSTSNGGGGPDENLGTMIFAPSGSNFGDFLFICSASGGGGDGIFTLAPNGTLSVWAEFNNCNGMDFDASNSLGNPGFSPAMFINQNSRAIVRYDSDADDQGLGSPLPFFGAGYRLSVPPDSSFAGGGLFAITEGDLEIERDGNIQRIPSVDPMEEAILWQSNLGDPTGAVFARNPEGQMLLYVLMKTDAELVAFASDGSRSSIVEGLSGEGHLAVSDDRNEIWIVEASRGQVLRLTF